MSTLFGSTLEERRAFLFSYIKDNPVESAKVLSVAAFKLVRAAIIDFAYDELFHDSEYMAVEVITRAKELATRK